MTVLQMEIVVGTIEIGGHHGNIVGAILKVIALAHLQTGNLGNGILLIGVFERRCEQRVFLHRLRSILGIDAGGTKEKELLYMMLVSLLDDVALHLHVLHDKVGAIERVGHNAAHKGRGQHHRIGLLLIEESLYSLLVGQIEFAMCTAHQVMVPSALKIIPNGRAHQAAMTCHKDLAVLIQRHNSIERLSITPYYSGNCAFR